MMLNKNILMALPIILSCNYAIADIKVDGDIFGVDAINECSTTAFKLSDIESRLRAYLEPEFNRVKNTKILAAETYNYLVGDVDSNLPDEVLAYRSLLTKYHSTCTLDVIESPRAIFSLKDFIGDYDAYADWIKLDHTKDPELLVCEKLYRTESNLIKNIGIVNVNNSKESKSQKSLIRYKHVLNIDMVKHECWKYSANSFIFINRRRVQWRLATYFISPPFLQVRLTQRQEDIDAM